MKAKVIKPTCFGFELFFPEILMQIAEIKMNSSENIDNGESYVVNNDECLNQTCKINVDHNSIPEEYVLSYSKENDFEPNETRIPKTSVLAANKRDVKDVYDDENYCLARSCSVQNYEVKQIEEKSHFCSRKLLIICLVLVVILLFCVTGGLLGALLKSQSKLI